MNKILPIQMQDLSLEPLKQYTMHDAAMQGNSLLTLQDFSVTFGSKVVLSGISFTVPEKGIVILTGPKGVERTTLMRTLAGFGAASFSYQTAGQALYRGVELGENEHPELVAQNAQLLMQSVLENVVVNLPQRSQLTKPMQRELAVKLLAEAGLQELCDRLDEKMQSLPLILQRHLAILREVVANPSLLCIDEPTAGMTDLEAARLIAYLRTEATRRALLVAMHNQTHARLLGGNAMLIAYGRMLELQPIPQIFDQPRTPAAIEFARTGQCSTESYKLSLQMPMTAPQTIVAAASDTDSGADSAAMPAAADSDVEAAAVDDSTEKEPPKVAAGKFMWLKRGMLAASPVPGAVSDVESDLNALREHGITTIMNLTEAGLDETLLQRHGLKSEWEPIPDLQAPTIAQGIRICKEIESLLQMGEVVAVQSDAGLGRAGTILVAHLLWKGISLKDALEYVRRVEPRWVQTQAQEDFLHQFAQRV